MNNIFLKVSPYTVVRKRGIKELTKYIDYVLDSKIDGDFVECGVFKGGMIMAMALKLLKKNIKVHIWGYDMFKRGMPSAQDVDIDSFGRSGNKLFGTYNCDKEEVYKNILSTNYDMGFVTLVEGDVSETLKSIFPSKISLLRIDVDFYEPTKSVLKYLFNRVTDGGVIIWDDYDCWKGCKLATDEFFGKEIFKANERKILIKQQSMPK